MIKKNGLYFIGIIGKNMNKTNILTTTSSKFSWNQINVFLMPEITY